jgi:hypothetical protein
MQEEEAALIAGLVFADVAAASLATAIGLTHLKRRVRVETARRLGLTPRTTHGSTEMQRP